MPKRRQHYVPRFYLKRFASDFQQANPRRINLYNIFGHFLRPHVSIKDQCFKPLFYGVTEDVENALSDLESQWSVTIKHICESGSSPPAGSEEHKSLLFFLAFQHLRTPRHAQQVDDANDQFMKSVMREDARVKNIDQDSFRFHIDNAVLFGMEPAMQVAMCFADLKVSLLEAPTECEFVASDNPVVMYNLYCEGYPHGGTTGAGQAGLLLFVPLSPRLSCLLYDGRVYKVGRPGNPKPVVCNTQDVFQLNGLEFMDADANLYFQSEQPIGYFLDIAKRYSRARKQVGLTTARFVGVRDTNKVMYQQYRYIPSVQLDLSFLTIRRNARRVPLLKRIRTWRDTIPWDQMDLASNRVQPPPGIAEAEVFRRVPYPKR